MQLCGRKRPSHISRWVFPDNCNACRRVILHLDVYCEFMVNGCSWIGALRNLDSHCEICDYREIQCMQCGQCIQFLLMRRHQDAVECPMRPEPCPHCRSDVPVQQMQAHLEKFASKFTMHVRTNVILCYR